MSGFWGIIISSVGFFGIGMFLGFLWRSKSSKGEIKSLQESFGVITQKLRMIEKEIIPPKNQVNSKSSSLEDNIYDVADRLDKIKIAIIGLKNDQQFSNKQTLKNTAFENSTSHSDTESQTEESKNIISEDVPLTLVVEDGVNFNTGNDAAAVINSPQQEIIKLYVQASENRDARDLFREKYAITRLGNEKAVEQRLGEASKPEFRALDSGNLLAVSSDDGLFYVLPGFDTTLNSFVYNEGGFGFIFDCPGYNADTTYSTVRVRHPAIFQHNGNQWTKIKNGELILE